MVPSKDYPSYPSGFPIAIVERYDQRYFWRSTVVRRRSAVVTPPPATWNLEPVTAARPLARPAWDDTRALPLAEPPAATTSTIIRPAPEIREEN